MSGVLPAALVAVLAATGIAAPATADQATPRRATEAEARAIRHAALDSLEGNGWRVSHIRISTARSAHRFASAAVDNRRTGVGGEMILRRSHRQWKRIFLGTDGFCDASAPRAVLRDLGFGC